MEIYIYLLLKWDKEIKLISLISAFYKLNKFKLMSMSSDTKITLANSHHKADNAKIMAEINYRLELKSLLR